MLNIMRRSLVILFFSAFIAAGISMVLMGSGKDIAWATVGNVAEGEDIQYDKSHGLLNSLGFDTSKTPSTYDPDRTTNPYGSDVSTLDEVEEMCLLRTKGNESHSLAKGTQLFGHNKKLDGQMSTLTKDPLSSNGLDFLNDLAFVTTAKVDVNGDGRDSLLAVVYTNYNYSDAVNDPDNCDRNIYLQLYDPTSQTIMPVPIVIGEFPSDKSRHYNFIIQSQLQVAAGDFDKDSVDEIAVYSPATGASDHSKVKIYDLVEGKDCMNPFKADSWRLAWNYILPVSKDEIIYDRLVNKKYVKNIYNNVDITAGDADNDGISDLVISYGASDTGYYKNDSVTGIEADTIGITKQPEQHIERSVPSRSVLLYGDDRGQMLKDSQDLSYGDDELIRVSFAFGDVDGDGNEDMFVGGQRQSEQADNVSRVLGKYTYDSDEQEMSIETMDDLKVVDGKWNDDHTKFTSSNGWDGEYKSAPLMKTDLTIGKIHGPDSDVRIYMDSVLYSFSDGRFDIADELEDNSEELDKDGKSYVPKRFKGSRVFTNLVGYYGQGASPSGPVKTSVYFEYDADSGNLTGGLNECMLVNRVTIPRTFDPAKIAAIPDLQHPVQSVATLLTQSPVTSNKVINEKPYYGNEDTHYKGAPQVLTTADTDKDSMVATYTGVHELVYQKPKVLAVMAAAPFYKDVADYDEGNMLAACSTDYGKSSGVTTGHTSTYSSSLGVFLNTSFGVKWLHGIINAELGWAREETWGYDDTREFTISYETGAEDAVVLYSIPTENYMYNVEGVMMNDDGSYETCNQLMAVADQHKPVTQTIALDDYIDIQSKNKDALPDVTKYLTSTPGEPGTYPKSKDDISKEAKKNLGKTDEGDSYAGIAYGDGSVTQSISTEHSDQDRYSNHLDGVYGSIEVGVGTELGDMDTPIGGMTIEGGLHYDFSQVSGDTKSELSGIECSGTVPNMPKSAKGYGYDFSWKLFKYEIKDKSTFPVISYIVDDVSAPPQLPDNIAQDFERTTDSQICLTWTYNHGDPQQFEIYRYEDFPQGGGDKLVGTVSGSDYKIKKDENGNTMRDKDGNVIKEYSFIETGLTADTKYQYRMKVKRVKNPQESIFSPVVEARTDVGTKPAISLSADKLTIYPDGKYDLSVLLADPENYQDEISYQWQKYDSVKRKWADMDGCEKKKITFYSCSSEDAGKYRCRVNLIRKTEGHPQYISAFTDYCEVTFSLRDVRFGDISVFNGQGISNVNTGLTLSVYNADQASLEKPTGTISFTLRGPNGNMNFSKEINEDTGEARIESIEDVIGEAGQRAFVDGGYVITARYDGSNIFYAADDPEEYHYLRNIDECIFLSSRSSYDYGEDICPSTELSDYKKDKTGNVTKEDLTGKLKTIKFYAADDRDQKTGDPIAEYELSDTDGKARVPLSPAIAENRKAYVEAYMTGKDGPVASTVIKTTKIDVEIKVRDKMTGSGDLLEFMSCKDVDFSGNIDPEEKNIITDDGNKSLSDYILFRYYEQNGEFICDSDSANTHKNDFVPAEYKTEAVFREKTNVPEDEPKDEIVCLFYSPTFKGAKFTVVGTYYKVSARAKDPNTGSVRMVQPDQATDFTDRGYAGGTKLTLKALPNKGYEVRSWIVNECGENIYTLKGSEKIDYTVKSANTFGEGDSKGKILIQAVMAPKDTKLTYGAKGNGTVSVVPDVESGTTVLADTKLTFKAVPQAGWRFEEWRVAISGGSNIVAEGQTADDGSNTKVFTMPDSSADVVGLFARDTINVVTSNDLEVSYINDGSDPKHETGEEVVTDKGANVPKGVKVIVKTKPGIELDPGSSWDVIVYKDSSTEPVSMSELGFKEISPQGREGCEFTLPQDVKSCSVFAQTVQGRYTVTAASPDVSFAVKVDGNQRSSGTAGQTVTVSDIVNGAQVDVTARPDRGKVIDKWIVNGEEKESDDNVYQTTIRENMNVSVDTKDDESVKLSLATDGGGKGRYVIKDKNGDELPAGTFTESSADPKKVDAYKGESVRFGIADDDSQHTLNAVIVDGEQVELVDGEAVIDELTDDTSVLLRFGPNTYRDVSFEKDWKTQEPVILDEDGAEIDNGKVVIPDDSTLEFSVVQSRDLKCVAEIRKAGSTGDYTEITCQEGSPSEYHGRYKYDYKVENIKEDKEIRVRDYSIMYITNEDEFYSYIEAVRSHPDKAAEQPDAVLMNDITLTEAKSHAGLDNKTPTDNYSKFDGKGHRISGIRIGTQADPVLGFHGLFGNLKEGAEIKDVLLDGMELNIAGELDNGNNALVVNKNEGTLDTVAVRNAKVASVKNGDTAAASVSGLATDNYGVIKNCMVTGLVIATDALRVNAGAAGVTANRKDGSGEVKGLMANNYFEDMRIKSQNETEPTLAADHILVLDTINDGGEYDQNYYKTVYDIDPQDPKKGTADPNGISVFTLTNEPSDRTKAEAEAATAEFSRKVAYKMNLAEGKTVWGNPVDASKGILELALGGKDEQGNDRYKAPIKVDFTGSEDKIRTCYLVPGKIVLPPADFLGGEPVIAWAVGDIAYAPGKTVEIDDDAVVSGIYEDDPGEYVASLSKVDSSDKRTETTYYKKMDDAAAAAMDEAEKDPAQKLALDVIGDCELTTDLDVSGKTTLTVKSGKTLTIANTSQIDNKGHIIVEDSEDGQTTTAVHKYGIISNEGDVLIPATCEFYNYGSKFADKVAGAAVVSRTNIICKPHIHGEWKYADKPNEDGTWTRTSTCEVCTNEISEKVDPNPPVSRIESIAVLQEPDKTVYEIGDGFAKKGLIVIANMTDGSKACLTEKTSQSEAGYTLALEMGQKETDLKDGDKLNEEGKAKVAVKYESLRCDFGIEILNTADLLTITDNSGKEIKNKQMKPGEELDLHASLKTKLPFRTSFTWQSSDESVAGLEAAAEGKDNTVITGKPGTAVITVTVVDEQGRPVSNIEPKTVEIENVSHITDLKIVGDDIHIEKGETHKVGLDITPKDTSDKVEWSIDDTAVAEVDKNGVITGKRGGKTTVTVKSPGGLEDSRKVYVYEKAMSLELDPADLGIRKDGSGVISARVMSATANGEIEWSIDKNAESKDSAAGFYVKNEKTGKMEVVDTVKTKLSGDGSDHSDSYVIVKGLKEGTAVVTARTEADKDAPEATGGVLEKECTVTVTDSDKIVNITHNGAIVSGETLNLDIEGRFINLGAVSTENAGETFEWSVMDDSDSPVLKVTKTAEDGSTARVTLLRKGTAAVTVKSSSGAADVCLINVVIAPRGIVLSDSEKSMMKGERYELKAKLTPDGSEARIRWSSSDKNIATIDDDGMITAVAKGSCVITADPGTEGVEPAKCKVNVTEVPVSIKLSAKNLEIMEGASRTLVAVVTPADAKGSLTWKSSQPKKVKVTSKGVVTGLKKGTATVTATFKGSQTVSASCKVKVLKDNTFRSKKAIARFETKGDKTLVLKWSKVKGADGYEVYFSRCDHDCKLQECKKVKTVKSNIRKWKKSGLKKGISFKAYVKAFKKQNGVKIYSKASPEVHAITGGYNAKYTNGKRVVINKKKVTLKVGGKAKVRGLVENLKKDRKLIPSAHAPKIRFESSDTSIAKVSSKGKIIAKSKGKCSIYVFAPNGVSKKVKVTVK